MTVAQLTAQVRQRLENAGLENSAMEARELVAHTAGVTPSVLLRIGTQESPASWYAAVDNMAARRIAGEPLQYILGEWAFMGLTFAVGSGVLIPRPETELLVETVLGCFGREARFTALDLCAGSGCIGLSVAALRRNAQVTLVEKSPEAFVYLEKNAQAVAPGSTLLCGDMFSAQVGDRLDKSYDVVLSNPPYICTQELDTLQNEVRREPRLALDGGADGLDFYRGIAQSYLCRVKPGGLLVLECGEGQARDVAALLAASGARCRIQKDLYGVERMVLAQPCKKVD